MGFWLHSDGQTLCHSTGRHHTKSLPLEKEKEKVVALSNFAWRRAFFGRPPTPTQVAGTRESAIRSSRRTPFLCSIKMNAGTVRRRFRELVLSHAFPRLIRTWDQRDRPSGGHYCGPLFGNDQSQDVGAATRSVSFIRFYLPYRVETASGKKLCFQMVQVQTHFDDPKWHVKKERHEKIAKEKWPFFREEIVARRREKKPDRAKVNKQKNTIPPTTRPKSRDQTSWR